MGATRPASGFLRQRLTNKRVISAVCEPLFGVWAFALMPAGRVAPLVFAFGGSVYCLRLVVMGLLPYYNNLHTEYLTSYTNTLQLIGYQHFNQCKILPILPTHNLHTPHAATRHQHGRMTSRHRGTEKSVAPTDFSTSLCRIIYCIRPFWQRGCGVRCVRCMQGSVRCFELILHSWNICVSICYAQKV